MITSITLGGYPLLQNNWGLQGIKNGSFPATVYTRSKHSGKNGNKLISPTFASYQLILDFIIIGTSVSDFVKQRDSFLGILGNVHQFGAQTLVITRTDGAMRQVDIKAIAVAGDVTTDNILSGVIEVTFEAEYPFFRGFNPHSQDVMLTNGGGIGIPMGIPLNFSAGATTPVTITNDGNYPAYPIFTFTGPLHNPTITNLQTGLSFSLSTTTLNLSDSAHSAVVDTFLGTVVSEPSGNVARQYASGTFWQVPVGTSTVQLTTSNGGDTGKCNISFYSTYLNI